MFVLLDEKQDALLSQTEVGALNNLTEPAINEHLDRISRAIVSEDPAQAIGSAKELIESTAKIVLRKLGKEADEAWDLPKLVLEAQKALKVHPSSAIPGADAADGVKKILGAATSITTGVAELRNRGYGTGHGPVTNRTGLGIRHARLAVGASRLWCEFMLDTLDDPSAPWQRATDVRPTQGHQS